MIIKINKIPSVISRKTCLIIIATILIFILGIFAYSIKHQNRPQESVDKTNEETHNIDNSAEETRYAEVLGNANNYQYRTLYKSEFDEFKEPVLIQTIHELEEFIKEWAPKYSPIKDITTRYDTEFFDENILYACPILVGSISYEIIAEKTCIDNNYLVLSINEMMPDSALWEVEAWVCMFAVNRDVIKTVDSVRTEKTVIHNLGFISRDYQINYSEDYVYNKLIMMKTYDEWLEFLEKHQPDESDKSRVKNIFNPLQFKVSNVYAYISPEPKGTILTIESAFVKDNKATINLERIKPSVESNDKEACISLFILSTFTAESIEVKINDK